MRKTLLCLVLLLLMVLSCACSKKRATDYGHGPTSGGEQDINDIRHFPQNLEKYAKNAGFRTILLDASAQEAAYKRFRRIFFAPWSMSKTSIKKIDVASAFKKSRGYKINAVPWTQEEWDEMASNAGLAAFPAMAAHAITLRNTDLRELPTHEQRFSEPTFDVRSNPFDYFQYAFLPIGTPLLVAHRSMDGKWFYVECPIAGGWVDAKDVGFVDENFKFAWTNAQLAALLKDRINLAATGAGGKNSSGNIGTVLPYASRNHDGSINVLVPVQKGGMAESAEISLGGNAAVLMPLELTPGNIAKIGNQMIGQKYGWGGMLGERDCSAMIRDLFTPFGLWLPRNSGAQARSGAILPLNGLEPAQKKSIIMSNGVPFLSLIGMKGHITLYLGAYKGQPAIFHNVWGVRIVRDGNDDERFVIGKAVVTSIEPGKELKNLYLPVTFVDRLQTLTNLGK